MKSDQLIEIEWIWNKNVNIRHETNKSLIGSKTIITYYRDIYGFIHKTQEECNKASHIIMENE